MKSKYTILILIIISILICGNTVFAQDYDYWEAKDNVELMNIKREISELLAENSKLSTEYNNLRREMYDLKTAIDNVVAEIKEMGENARKAVGRQGERTKEIKIKMENIKQMQDDALIAKSRLSLLKGKALDSEEKMNLRNLKLKELDYKKRELEMEWEMKASIHASEMLKEKEGLDRLTQKLEQNLRKKQELESQVISQKTKVLEATESIRTTSAEIKALEEKLKLLQKEKEYKSKMIVFLKDRRTIVVKEQELTLWDDEYNKVILAEEVRKLKKEHEDFNNAMKVSLSSRTRKRELLEQVMEIDKENQQLRRQIADYEKTIELIK
ncbi:MAG: hypothetical protein KKF78_00505 [Candidatus Omnitrophica bacterium]|nr:hypothetical protein [Candidatus Omnitrophota bacterium]